MSEDALAPEFIDVAGRRLRHVRVPGAVDTVVLVHGIGGNLGIWAMNLPALAATGRPVAAIDLPGHGLSSKALLDAVEAF